MPCSAVVALCTCHRSCCYTSERCAFLPRNKHVAPSQKAVHGRARHFRVARVWVRRWCVLGRITLTSRSHVEAEVVQEQYRRLNHCRCLQHRSASLVPSVACLCLVTMREALRVLGVLLEAQNIDV